MMEDRERGQAVFSTANGNHAYREARRVVRPIFREDFCSTEDAKAMAQTLQNDFPEQCKLMTAATARHIQDYFDPVDIQMQGRGFLHEVLMNIVHCNFQAARKRVQEYVEKVTQDSARFECLKIEDLESDVFTEEEQNLVGYDNTLPAALVILKQSKFPQVFHGYASYPPEMRLSNPTAAVAGAASNQADAVKVAQAGQEHRSQVEDPLTGLAELRPLPNVRGLGTTEPPLKVLEESALQSRHPHDRPLAVEIPKSTETLTNRNDLSSGHEVLQTALHDHTTSSSRQRHVYKPPRGIPNPIKKTSDDIRRQKITTGREDLPLPVEQTGFVSTVSDSGQYSPIPYSGHFSEVPMQTNAIPFHARSELDVYKRSAVENSTKSLKNYQSGDLGPSLHTTGKFNSSHPRYVSNPFSSSGLEGLEGGGEDKSHVSNMNPEIRKKSTQVTYEQFRPGDFGSMSGALPAHSMPPYQAFESTNTSHPNQRLDIPPKASRVSTSNPPTASTYSQIPVIYGQQRYPEKFNRSGKLSEAYPSAESEAFLPQLNYVQNVGRLHPHNQRDRSRSSVLPASHNQRNRGPSSQKPTSQAQRPPPFPDNCTLHVSSLPLHFSAKDLWEMLSPVPGLKWTADPKKAPGKEFSSSKIAFHEPWLAIEALNLLPKTHFPAMQGRFLYVRPFEPRGTGPMRLDTSSMAIKPQILHHHSPTPGGSTLPRGNQMELLRDENAPISISGPVQQAQKTSESGQHIGADAGYRRNREHQRRNTEDNVDSFGKDQPGAEATEKTSVASNGSPVKRKKSNRFSPSKTARKKSINLSPSRQSKDPKEIPKEEIRELALEAAEAAAHDPPESKQSIVSTDVQPVQTRLPLEQPIDDRATTVNLVDSSKTSQLSDLHQVAKPAEPVGACETGQGIARRDHALEQVAVPKPSSINDLYRKSTRTQGEASLLTAIPKLPVVDSTSAQSETKVPKLKGGGPPSSKIPKQQKDSSELPRKKPVSTEKSGHQHQTERASIAKDPVVEHDQGKSLISSATEVDIAIPSKPVPRRNPDVIGSFKKTSTDVLPDLKTDSISTGGETSATPISPITLPTTTLPTEEATTPDAEYSCALGNAAQKKSRTSPISSNRCVDSERLRSKLEATDIHSRKASQDIQPVPEGDLISDQNENPKTIHESDEKHDHEKHNESSGPFKDLDHKVFSNKQEEPKSRASGLEALHADNSKHPSCQSSTKFPTENAGQAESAPTAPVSKQEGPHPASLSESSAANTVTTIHLSTNHNEQQEITVRSGSIIRSLTPAPIITRRRKQKKIENTLEEKIDTASFSHTTGENQEGETMQILPNEKTTGSEVLSTEATAATEIPCETPSKDESDVFHDPKSDSAQSLKFHTPPTTPYPKSESSQELSPVTPLALTNDQSKAPRKISNPKSKTNRKKNRPGKKKSKSYGKPSLDVNASGSTIVSDHGPTSGTHSRSDYLMSDVNKKSQPDSEAADGLEGLRSPQNQDICDKRLGDNRSETFSKHYYIYSLLNENRAIEISKISNPLETTNSDDPSLDKGIGELTQLAQKPLSITTGDELGESVAAQELLSRSSTAAIARIEDLFRRDDESRTQNDMHLFPEDHQGGNNNQLCSHCANDIQNDGQQHIDQTSSDLQQLGPTILNEYQEHSGLSTTSSNLLRENDPDNLDTSRDDGEMDKGRSPETQSFVVADSAGLALDTPKAYRTQPETAQSKVKDVEGQIIDEKISAVDEKGDLRHQRTNIEGGRKTIETELQPRSDESDIKPPKVEKGDNGSQAIQVIEEHIHSLTAQHEIKVAARPDKSKSPKNTTLNVDMKVKHGKNESFSSPVSSKIVSSSDQPTPKKPRSTTSSLDSENHKASPVSTLKPANVSPNTDTSSTSAPSTPAPKPRPLPTPKLSYATALSSPAPAPKTPSEVFDAWTLKGEEAWGTRSSSNNDPGEGSRASAPASSSSKAEEDEEGGKRVWTLAKKKKGGRGGGSV